jgi:hypothetical protein
MKMLGLLGLERRGNAEGSGVRRPLRRADRWIGAGMAAIALFWPSGALAQSKEELAKAKATFQEGVALSAGHDWSGALAKFREVARVKMTPAVAFNIGECEEHLGKLVSALGNYRLAQSGAAGDPKAKQVAEAVGPRISALEERIPKLTITRGKGAETATILLDGAELGSTQIGEPKPMDPGPHEIIARVGDREGYNQTITIAEKEAKTVEVVIEPPKKEEPKKEVVQAPPPPPPPPPPPKGPSVPGIVLLSLGVASAGASAGLFFGPRQSTINELEEKCGGDTTCPPSAKPIADKGRLYTGIAEGALGVGIVGIVTGVILLATHGSGKPTPSTGQAVRFIGAAPGASSGGLSVVGRF